MLKFYAKRCCGCCTEELRFQSPESIQAAWTKAGLDCAATIVDDEGETHEEIDTFYGYTTNEEDVADRSLGYLIEQID